MKTLNHFLFSIYLLLLFGCEVSPQPIDYGNEVCDFCKMTIVDTQHATEIVTKKGKTYKFDASECMVNFINDFEVSKIKLYLTNHYTNPEVLIDATKATFLISKNIPSPMGAFLTAFETRASAEQTQQEKGGQLYTWDQLLQHINGN